MYFDIHAGKRALNQNKNRIIFIDINIIPDDDNLAKWVRS